MDKPDTLLQQKVGAGKQIKPLVNFKNKLLSCNIRDLECTIWYKELHNLEEKVSVQRSYSLEDAANFLKMISQYGNLNNIRKCTKQFWPCYIKNISKYKGRA